VDEKWVQTPRGLFPLKRFFGGGKANEQTGEDVAYEVIKQKLLELVAQEDKANPLSDEELVARLNAAGYPVKRRTVTKYRKLLRSPSSRQRKDWSRIESRPSPSSSTSPSPGSSSASASATAAEASATAAEPSATAAEASATAAEASGSTWEVSGSAAKGAGAAQEEAPRP